MIFRKVSCACGGGCPACKAKSGDLKISQPNDPAEIEADAIADKVMRMPVEDRPALHKPSMVASPNLIPHLKTGASVLYRQEHTEAGEEPSPLTEGLGTVAENLGENNPAFTEFTENLADEFLSQPPAMSVGVPVFLGANYAFLWGMAMANPAMRRHFDDFNIAMLPGLIPQFPIKTFTYRILNGEQTRFEFDFGLDASALLEVFNEGVLNTHISTLSFESSGGLDTEAESPVSLSSLQVNLGLFDDGLMLTGGFRPGISPYPLFERDDITGESSRIGAQFPAMPDLMRERQDVRFMVQLDLVRLYNHFNPDSPPIRSMPIDVEGDTLARKASATGNGYDVGRTDGIEQVLSSSGQTLDSETRDFFEPRLGFDLGGVRIHTGDAAAESARSVNARAYTLGRDIVFGSGEFAPHSASGRHLLAHELAHVAQQSANRDGSFGNYQKSATASLLQRAPEDKPTPRRDVVILGEDWEGGAELASVLGRGGKVIKVTSIADAAAALSSIDFPIANLYFITHSTVNGDLKFGAAEGMIPPANIATHLTGLITAANAPDRVDFRGCSVGSTPQAMEGIRAALGAKSVVAGTCFAVISLSTPIKIGEKPVTKASDVTPATLPLFNSLYARTARKFGDHEKCIVSRQKKDFFAAGGRFVALWFNKQFTGAWVPGESVCYTEVTPRVVDPKAAPAAAAGCNLIVVEAPPAPVPSAPENQPPENEPPKPEGETP
ncbi:MAG: DUF4157 domain-containing protein [Pyrinomonadaceae bacterium]